MYRKTARNETDMVIGMLWLCGPVMSAGPLLIPVCFSHPCSASMPTMREVVDCLRELLRNWPQAPWPERRELLELMKQLVRLWQHGHLDGPGRRRLPRPVAQAYELLALDLLRCPLPSFCSSAWHGAVTGIVCMCVCSCAFYDSCYLGQRP